MKTLNAAVKSVSYNLQEEFDLLLANQDWYGLSLCQKLDLLCKGKTERAAVVAQRLVEVTNARRVKQKTLPKVKTRNRIRPKGLRSKTVLFEVGIKTSVEIISAGRNLLRSIGRKVQGTMSQIENEVLCLNLGELAWKMKEEAVYTAYQAFKAAALSA